MNAPGRRFGEGLGADFRTDDRADEANDQTIAASYGRNWAIAGQYRDAGIFRGAICRVRF
jgi:hypothetical protein